MPKIFGDSLKLHREQTRDALFSALTRLMIAKGFGAITMSELAKEAGVGRTSVYNHFSDKEEVLMAFVAQEIDNYIKALREDLSTTKDPITMLRIYVRSQLLTERSYLNAPGPPLRDVISSNAAREMVNHVRQSSAVLTEILQTCISQGCIPDTDIKVISQLVHGCLTGRRVPREEPARTAFFEATERFVLQAVGATVPGKLPDIGKIPPPCE